MTRTARGLRNNNPLNIRKGNDWKGERKVQHDPAFEEFESMQMGLRAGFIILRNYITGYGGKSAKFNTIEKIISRWAPPSENATRKYIDFVATCVDKHPKEVIEFSDAFAMCQLVRAMCFVECGQWIDFGTIESSYNLLL